MYFTGYFLSAFFEDKGTLNYAVRFTIEYPYLKVESCSKKQADAIVPPS
jgi:hypothetical protein